MGSCGSRVNRHYNTQENNGKIHRKLRYRRCSASVTQEMEENRKTKGQTKANAFKEPETITSSSELTKQKGRTTENNMVREQYRSGVNLVNRLQTEFNYLQPSDHS